MSQNSLAQKKTCLNRPSTHMIHIFHKIQNSSSLTLDSKRKSPKIFELLKLRGAGSIPYQHSCDLSKTWSFQTL